MSATGPARLLLRDRGRASEPGARIVCFPFGGGGVVTYLGWRRRLPRSIEVVAVELPGRWGNTQAPYEDLNVAALEIAEAVQPIADVPIILFGCSMGAVLAYEVARTAARDNLFQVAHLFVAARAAPHLPVPRVQLSLLPDEELVAAVGRNFGALPSEALEDPKMKALTLDALRVDLRLLERYAHEPGEPLECPITAFCGSRDPLVRVEHVERYQELTSRALALTVFDAPHLFLRSHEAQILDSIVGVTSVLASMAALEAS